MFGFIPPIKVNDNLTIDAFDSRKEGEQVNIDFVRVTTINEEGKELITQFGIQGRSDHLAESLRNRSDNKEAASTKDVPTDTVEVVAA